MTARALTLAGVSSVALLIVDVMASFVVTPLLINGLGAAQYGAWDIIVGLIGYFGFLDLGISAAILRYVAHASSARTWDVAHAYLATGLWSLAAIGLAGALLALGVLSVVPPSAPTLASTPAALWRLMLVISSLVALSLPLNALSAFLLGRQRNVGVNALRILLTILRAVAVFYIVTSGQSDPLLWLLVLLLVLQILEILIFVIWISRLEGATAMMPRRASLPKAKELLAYGFNSTLLMLGTGSLKRLIGLVIAKTIGLGQVVHFAVVNRLVEYAQALVIAVGFPLTAHFSELAGTGTRSQLRDAYIRTTRLVQFFSLGVPVGLFWLGEPFLLRWLGPDVATYAHKLLAILCFTLLLQGFASNANRLLLALARHRGVAVFSAASSPVLILVAIVLTQWLGVAGAALAVCIHGTANAIVELHCAEVELRFRPGESIRLTALPYALPLAMMSLLLWGLREVRYPDSYVLIVGYGLAAAALYATSASYLVYRESPARFIRRILHRREVP